jgi:glycosyltransferase involved in cell wall biosynthesis
MSVDQQSQIRVLYSFPFRLGGDGTNYTAWQQVNGLAAAGAKVLVFAGSISKPVPPGVRVYPTLAKGGIRIPGRVLGPLRMAALHDHIVARRIMKMKENVDIIHAWPLGARQTLAVAVSLGIPTALERCNAHTRFAMEVVNKECARLGLALPPDHSHAYNAEKLRREVEEYELADKLLCPSDFVVRTFLELGYSLNKLARHQYGFDPRIFHPYDQPAKASRGLTMLFAGGCAPRKGLHYALEAWLQSPAHRDGRFLIAGTFIPGYADKLASMLAHPSVQVLGHRRDISELMRKSDLLVLPSVEEGSALVTAEARASGCVILVSEAAGAICTHMENALVHQVGNVEALARHITMLHEDRELLKKLRAESLRTAAEITWTAAGARLFQVYLDTIAAKSERMSVGKSPDSSRTLR